MAGQLDHVAICSANLDMTIDFFETVFHMTILRESGERPFRKVWFQQGIQVNEISESGGEYDGIPYSHIAIRVTDETATRMKLMSYGCKNIDEKKNWFLTREGIIIELL